MIVAKVTKCSMVTDSGFTGSLFEHSVTFKVEDNYDSTHYVTGLDHQSCHAVGSTVHARRPQSRVLGPFALHYNQTPITPPPSSSSTESAKLVSALESAGLLPSG